MKKSLLAVAVAAVFAACNSNPKTATDTNAIASADTTGFRQFQMMKQQQAVKEQLGIIDTRGVNDGANYTNTMPSANVSSVSNSPQQQEAPPTRTVTHIIYRDVPVATTSHSHRTSRAHHYSKSNSYSSASTASVRRKKGWSSAAKGTVIGAGSGAVVGALISKDHSKGAIIGGLLGAGGGYVVGRGKDKRNGRY